MSRPWNTPLLALVLAALVLGGCSNPDATHTGREPGEEPRVANAGEPDAPPPPSASSSAPAGARRSPAGALASFAELYVNWSYDDLAREQRALAAESVGAARSAELQAAASSGADTTLRAARLENSGSVVSVAPDQSSPGLWVIVTREQTSGTGEYEGLPATYHVTLARLASTSGGYAVSEWLPQS